MASNEVQTVKIGDDAVVYTDTLALHGAVLPDIDTVTFHLKLKSDPTIKFSKDATFSGSTVTFTTEAGYVNMPTIAGIYLQNWNVIFASGRNLTFPTKGSNLIKFEKGADDE